MDGENKEFFDQLKSEHQELSDQEITDIIADESIVNDEQSADNTELEIEGEITPEEALENEEGNSPVEEDIEPDEVPAGKYVPLQKHKKMAARAQGAESKIKELENKIEEMKRQILPLGQPQNTTQNQPLKNEQPSMDEAIKQVATDAFRKKWQREPDVILHPEDLAEYTFLMNQATTHVTKVHEQQRQEAIVYQNREANYNKMLAYIDSLEESEPRIKEIANFAVENLPKKEVDRLLAEAIDNGNTEVLLESLEKARKMYYQNKGWGTGNEIPEKTSPVAPQKNKISLMDGLPKITGLPSAGGNTGTLSQKDINKALATGDLSNIPKHIQDQLLGSPLR